jgi:hypothetical protein
VGTVGGVVSTVQEAVAGVLSGVPAAVANTENVWLPFVRAEYVRGLVHACEPALSSLHVKVAGVIVEWNVNVAVVLVVSDAGALSITVSGLGGLGAAAAGDASAPRSATTVKPPVTPVKNRWRSPTLMAPFPG